MLPLVIRVPVPQASFHPDAVDTEVYCVNKTDRVFFVAVNSEFFTTLDELTGESVLDGSLFDSCVLAPGEAAKIAELKAGDSDRHAGLGLSFRGPEGVVINRSYDLKSSDGDLTLPGDKTGRIIPPLS